MKTVAHPPTQTAQRVKVGMIGLAAVVLLIGLASAIFSSVTRERPMAAGSAMQNASIAASAPAGNMAQSANEPLAELGVAPSTSDGNGVAPAEAAKR